MPSEATLSNSARKTDLWPFLRWFRRLFKLARTEDSAPPKPKKRPTPANPAKLRAPDECRAWTPERIRAAEMLFGPGHVLPIPAEAMRKLVVPMGLDEKVSAVDLRSGAGLAARLLAEMGTWVEVLESDPVLADHAEHLARADGVGKKVKVLRNDLMSCDIRPRSRMALFSYEGLSSYTDKAAAIRKACSLLKPLGQIVLFEIIANEEVSEAHESLWNSQEYTPYNFISGAKLREILETLDFEIMIFKDVTTDYCRQVMGELSQFAARTKPESLDFEMRPWLAWEAEYWARRVAILQQHQLSAVWVHARLPFVDPHP